MTEITDNTALQSTESATPPRKRGLVKRLLPLGVIAVGMAVAFALGLAVLSLVPVVYKKVKARRQAA